MPTFDFARPDGSPWPAPWSATFTSGGVVDVQDGAGRLRTGAAGGYADRTRVEYVGTPNNLEILFTMWVTAGDRTPHLVLRNAGLTLADDANRVEAKYENDGVAITETKTGATSPPLAPKIVIAPYAAPTKTRVRLAGSNLKLKVWPAANPEPASWQADVTITVGGTGSLGWFVVGSGAAASQSVFIDNITITDTDAATDFLPYPVSATPIVGWRYIAATLNGNGTETPLAVSLPLSDVSITDPISTAPEISFNVTPEIMRLRGPNDEPLLRVRSTAIYAELDGVIRAGGVVTKMTTSGPSLQVTCAGFISLIDGEPWTNRTIRSVGADPADLCRIIWSYWQSHKYANVGLTLPAGLRTGARIGTAEEPITLAHYANVDLGSLFNDMCEAGSIDYRERHKWEPNGTISHRLEMGSPRLGRRRTDIQFVIGSNVAEVPSVDFHTDDYASEVMVLGAGEGDKMTRGHAANSNVDRLRRVKAIPSKGIGLVATANLFAEKWVRNYATSETDVDSLVVIEHPLAPLFSWDPGDEVFLSGDSMWGGRLGMWVRILATTISPDKAQTATLKVARADKAV